MENLEIDDVTYLIHGIQVASGRLSIIETAFSVAIVLHDQSHSDEKLNNNNIINDDNENPLKKDHYLLNPLSEPYLIINNFHLFDISYYTDLTKIEQPPRLCFHDPTKEKGITINFPDKERFNAFYNQFGKRVTIVDHGISGFYKIITRHPSYYPFSDFPSQKNELKKKFLSVPLATQETNPAAYNAHFIKHSTLMSHISSQCDMKTQALNDTVLSESVLGNLTELKKFIRSNLISSKLKARVWATLLGMDINNLDQKFVTQYRSVKNQWKSIRYSQYKRTKLFQEHIETLSETIVRFQQKLLTVVRDYNILQTTFDIIMSITQIYYELHSNYTELLYLIRVFYSMFVKEVKYEKDDYNEGRENPLFVIDDRTTMNSETFETFVFWSLLALLEKGELNQVFANLKSGKPDSVTSQISDFLFVADPQIFHALLSDKDTQFSAFLSTMSMSFSDIFPLCDCSDFWIALLASDNMPSFCNCFIISSILISYTGNASGQPIQAFQLFMTSLLMCDHWHMIKTAFVLLDLMQELMQNKA